MKNNYLIQKVSVRDKAEITSKVQVYKCAYVKAINNLFILK